MTTGMLDPWKISTVSGFVVNPAKPDILNNSQKTNK